MHAVARAHTHTTRQGTSHGRPQILAATDVLIDSTYGVRDYAELLAAYGLSGKERYPCLEQQRVWRNDKRQNARGGNDWWESAYAEPDVLLEGTTDLSLTGR